MRILTKPASLLALGAALSLSACVGDGDSPSAFVEPAVGGALFARYVSMGNSITAGFQSGGINDSTQIRAYPVMLAAKAGAVFNAPLIRTIPGAPGSPCPRPFVAPLTPGAPLVGGCVRITNPRWVNNVAVPGERIGDVVNFNPNTALAGLHTLLAGPTSQLDAMKALDPTLVSVWIGNNDALSAALSGTLGPAAAGADSLLTRLSLFNASLATLTDGIASEIDTSAGEDAILIGVVDPVMGAPHLQPGAYFFLARDAAGKYNGKPVNNNCSPVTALGTPNPLAANMISFSTLASALPEINCDPASPQGGAYLLDASEIAVLRARVAAYNTAIHAAATAHGWIYIDPNATVATYLTRTDTDPAKAGQYNFIRKCQGLATATTAAQFQAAVLFTCPVTGPTAAPNFFGSLFSYDGVHPSTAAHAIFANVLAGAINAKHSLSLATS